MVSNTIQIGKTLQCFSAYDHSHYFPLENRFLETELKLGPPARTRCVALTMGDGEGRTDMEKAS